jgi:hypothetical protein
VTDELRRYRGLGSFLDYVVSHIPIGGMYGANGATSEEQCAELMEYLHEFESLSRRLGLNDLVFIEGCRWHIEGYGHYLSRRRHFRDYADYITRHKGSPKPPPWKPNVQGWFGQSEARNLSKFRPHSAGFRQALARTIKRGHEYGFSTGELVDLLSVRRPTILSRAGYSDAEQAQALEVIGDLSDEETAAAEVDWPLAAELEARAEHSGRLELAWERADAQLAIAALARASLAILGGELWLVAERHTPRSISGVIPQRDGAPAVYGWTTNREGGES